MITVSKQYKNAMDKHIRNRSFMSVGVGVINQEAQSSAKIIEPSNVLYYSNKNNVFASKELIRYASMDQNYSKVDGSMYFVPRESDEMQLLDVGYATYTSGMSVVIEFNNTYDIKGITINFTHGYPTKFKIETDSKNLTYTNDSEIFKTTDVLGNTKHIKIIPITMVGGEQRLRIDNIMMGIGLVYTNSDIKTSSYSSTVSPISEELSRIDFSVTINDSDNRYNIDDDNSFINFLETKQKISVSYGIELDDGTVEYVNKANLLLDSWNSSKGSMTFNAVDAFAFMDDEYSLGYKIYTRTAYDEAVQVLTDCGFEPDEYEIDESLKDISLVNPMPKCTHKEALQLLANACRCILYQNNDGKVVIRANFANNLTSDDLVIESSSEAEWSKKDNVLTSAYVEYAEFMKDYIKVDGTSYFIPQNGQYGTTGFVSEDISDENGNFINNPKISITLPASYQFYGIFVDFGGRHPEEVTIRTYLNDEVSKIVSFNNIEEKNYFVEDYGLFNKIEVEVTKGYPLNRVLINHLALGDLTDYTVKRDDMFENPTGYNERKTKDVYVKIYSFENKTRKVKDEDGNEIEETYVSEVEDDVYYKKSINIVGDNQNVNNPLISNEDHAELVAKWLGNHYYNNTEYDVVHRGEPRASAGDIIYYESEVAGILQTEILSENIIFNGALRGSFTLKKALKNEVE